MDNPEGFFKPDYLAKHELRTECYKQTLQSDVSLFYQLVESIPINILYSRISQIIHLSNDIESFYSKQAKKSTVATFAQISATFQYMFETAFYSRTFDTKILKDLVRPEQYEAIMEKAKEYIEKDTKNEEQ